MRLNWGPWLYGLVGGFIGGGAAAASTGIAQLVTDPTHSDIHHLMVLMAVSYVVGGVITALAFLKQSPLPPPIQLMVTETTKTGGTVTEVKMSGQIPQSQDKEIK